MNWVMCLFVVCFLSISGLVLNGMRLMQQNKLQAAVPNLVVALLVTIAAIILAQFV